MTDPVTVDVVAEIEKSPDHHGPVSRAEAEAADDRSHGVWIDAWRTLRRKPMFLISVGVIFVLALMAFFPEWFASGDPNKGAGAQSSRPVGRRVVRLRRQWPQCLHPRGVRRQGVPHRRIRLHGRHHPDRHPARSRRGLHRRVHRHRDFPDSRHAPGHSVRTGRHHRVEHPDHLPHPQLAGGDHPDPDDHHLRLAEYCPGAPQQC